MAKLNCQASQQAKNKMAYDEAFMCLMVAKQCVENQALWKTDPTLAFTLYYELIDVEFLMGHVAEAEHLIDIVQQQLVRPTDSYKLKNLYIVKLTLLGRYAEAIRLGRDLLAHFDIVWPDHEDTGYLLALLNEVKGYLNRPETEDFENHQRSVPAKDDAALQTLANLIAPAYISDQFTLSVSAAIAAKILFSQGYSAEAGIVISTLGVAFVKQAMYQDAYICGQLAIKLSVYYQDYSQQCKAQMVFAACINHWMKSVQISCTHTGKAFELGKLSGELQYAGYNLYYDVISHLYQGTDLSVLSEKNKISD